MHSFLKWFIYAAIVIFTLAFGLVLVLSLSHEFRAINTTNQIKVDSIAYELKCAQDSFINEMNTSVEINSDKIDSIATVVHKVESVSTQTDKKLKKKYEKALRIIDSIKDGQ